MRRTLATLMMLGTITLSGGFARAAEPQCTAMGVSPDPITCTYTADGPGTFTAVSTNPWTITVVRDFQTVVLASGSIFTPYSTGGVATLPGELVTVSINAQRTMGVPRAPHGFVRSGKDG